MFWSLLLKLAIFRFGVRFVDMYALTVKSPVSMTEVDHCLLEKSSHLERICLLR